MPAGVTAKVLKYPDNSGTIPVLFTASQDCKVSHFKVHPQISNDSGLKGNFRQTLNMNYAQNNRHFYQQKVDNLTLGIGEKAPFKIKAVKNTLPLPRYGYHDITITILFLFFAENV